MDFADRVLPGREGRPEPRTWSREAAGDERYAFAAGRLSVIEERLLSYREYERFAAADTSRESRSQILDAAGYPPAESLEARVQAGRLANNLLLQELDPEGYLSSVLLLDIDYHNIKVLLKYYLGSEEAVSSAAESAEEPIRAGRPEDLPRNVRTLLIQGGPTAVSGLMEEIVDQIRDTGGERTVTEMTGTEAVGGAAGLSTSEESIARPDSAGAVRRLLSAYRAHPEALTIDIEADKLLFEEAARLAGRRSPTTARGFLADYVALKADIANLQMLLRVRRFRGGTAYLRRILVPGGDVPASVIGELYDASPEVIGDTWNNLSGLASSLAEPSMFYSDENGVWNFGEHADNLLARLAEVSRRQSYSADKLAGYWLSRSVEIQNLRILISGLERGHSGTELLELLRDVYRRERL